jgi:3-phenylpropionate/cinnamic acid dioxygenase small subunit
MPSLLEDKDAIRELLAEYCFRFDSGRFEEWLDLFTSEGAFEVDGLGRFAGRAALHAFLSRVPLTNGAPAMRHCVMNAIVSVDGDSASARSYVLVARGGERLDLGVAGRYEDRLARTPDGWRFAERKALLDFMNR